MKRQDHYQVPESCSGKRIDQALPLIMNTYSRAQVQRWIKEGLVLINNTAAKKGNRVKEGDRIIIQESKLKPSKFKKKNIPLKILFEDQDLLVVDKPSGLLTHPSAYERENTLVNAILHHCGKNLSGIGGELRPGIVHRLDKDTSGVLLVAKHDEAHRDLAKQMEHRQVKKEYLALVKGVPQTRSGTIDAPLGRKQNRGKQMIAISAEKKAKSAKTHFTVEKVFEGGYALLRIQLETGRMHQIRVHMAAIGLPVVGDRMYGDPETNQFFKDNSRLDRQFLHACRIEFMHPRTGKMVTVESPLPEDLKNALICHS